jgi:hypothetical protein
MKNLISSEKEHVQKDSFHSQICSASNTDLIYRKAYKGDWGHWDDLPDNDCQNQNDNLSAENEIDNPTLL